MDKIIVRTTILKRVEPTTGVRLKLRKLLQRITPCLVQRERRLRRPLAERNDNSIFCFFILNSSLLVYFIVKIGVIGF